MIPCELSDLPVDQCACRIHSAPAATFRDFAITARFPARFDSRCDYCEKPMAEGDPIARTDDGDYICERCAP
jgi:hypothetical protein